MLKILEPHFNKHYFKVSLLIYIICNLFVIDNLPFGDDYIFIFSETEIANAPNPFLFFFPWSDYFKSWGLSYFVLWNMFKLFGSNFVYYRAINLILHFLNFYLLRRLLKLHSNKNITLTNLTSLLFLFSPLSILTTSWIFQIKTLLALFFILAMLIHLEKVKIFTFKSYLTTIILFTLSLLSKVSGILLPIYLFFWYRTKVKSLKRAVFFSLPFIFIALIYGVINIKGITHLVTELQYLKKNNSELVVKNNITRTEMLSIKQKDVSQHKEFNFDINIYSEITEGANKYFSSLGNLTKLTGKYIIALQNLGRLTLSTLGLYDYYPFYENNLNTALSKKIYLYSVIGLCLLTFLIYLKSNTSILLLCLFLPISGFFYIPYMKFSYSSDHWFYTASIGLILLILKRVNHKGTIITTLSICFLSYIYTQIKYESFPSLLVQNSEAYKNRIIMEHQARYQILAGDTLPVLKNYLYYFNKTQMDNIDYSAMIYRLAYKHNLKEVSRKVYNMNAKLYINLKDINLLKKFTLDHYGVVPENILNYTEAFNAIYSHKLEKELYHQVIKQLE